MKETAKLISEKIKELLPNIKGKGENLFKAMDYASKTGKRLRPYLVIESANLFNVPLEYSLRAGAALEMVHCFSLIHDDLPAIDNDNLRRGNPTCHKKFDEATAILAGDGLLAYAFKVISDEETHQDEKIRNRLTSLLANSTFGMIEGEFTDILADRGGEFSLDEIISMQNLKTGCLISCATMMGAVLGNASKEETEALRKYGLNIGLAFQIADDILDVEGDPEKMGKALRKDKDAGKATFVSLLGSQKAKEYAKDLIDNAVKELFIFGKKNDKLAGLAQFIISRDK